jgi:hypothetical protein
MAFGAATSASIASKGSTYLNGNKVLLNTGNSPLTPEPVTKQTQVAHIDTAYSGDVGFINPAPEALPSVCSRSPAHFPWVGSGKGVDVAITMDQPSSSQVTTNAVDAINEATPNVPAKPTTPAITNSVPPLTSNGAVNGINASAITAFASQQAASFANLIKGSPTTPAIPSSAVTQTGPNGQPLQYQGNYQQQPVPQDSQIAYGVLPGPSGMTLTQATQPGSILMPGSAPLIYARVQQGMPWAQALQGFTTGNFGATSPLAILNNPLVQHQAIGASFNNATSALRSNGMLTGYESSGQAGGVVMAASQYGVPAVMVAAKIGIIYTIA